MRWLAPLRCRVAPPWFVLWPAKPQQEGTEERERERESARASLVLPHTVHAHAKHRCLTSLHATCARVHAVHVVLTWNPAVLSLMPLGSVP